MHPVSFQPSTAAPARKPFPRGTGGSSPLNFAKFRRIGRNCRNLSISCKPGPASGSKTSGCDDFTVGENDAVIIVDHGSRRQKSNLMLNDFVAMFRARTGYKIVEPAHMELAEPTIKDAFGKCAEQGASRVIVSPYFLSPGRHRKQQMHLRSTQTYPILSLPLLDCMSL